MISVRPALRLFAVAGILAFSGVLALRANHLVSGQSAHPPPMMGGPPPLQLPPGTAYTTALLGTKVVNPTGRPVAQLAAVPADLSQGVATQINTHAGQPGDPTDAPGVVAYQLLSSIRYTGSTNVVYVTTARASHGAEAQGMRLGNQIVALSDGSTAYASVLPGNDKQIVWSKDGVLISVIGDVSADELTKLASGVVLAK